MFASAGSVVVAAFETRVAAVVDVAGLDVVVAPPAWSTIVPVIDPWIEHTNVIGLDPMVTKYESPGASAPLSKLSSDATTWWVAVPSL